MKRIISILSLAVTLTLCAWMTPLQVHAQETTVSFQLFYDQLSPYGMWVDYQSYGYVWIPEVGNDFSPYGTEGYWVFTDYGWTWVSNYSWGWAPFHYGRWVYDDLYGWLWVPDNVWGPAWVLWRTSPGYYGWAPMGPGISIEVAFGGGYTVPSDRWIFVSDRYITSPEINRYYVDRSTNVTIINSSTVVNNTYVDNSRHVTYVAGPAKNDVQKVTGATIKPVAIQEIDKPGQALANDQLKIYRPRVQANADNGRKPAPSKVMDLKEVKPRGERQPGNRQRNENQPPGRKEQPSQQQNARPSEDKGRGQQPSVVNPSDRGNKQPPQQRTVTPPERKGKEQPPPNVTPQDKAKGSKQPAQPPAVKPTDKDKKTAQQPKGKNAPLPKKKGKGNEPPPKKSDDH